MADPLERLFTMGAAVAAFLLVAACGVFLAIDTWAQAPVLAWLVARFERDAGVALLHQGAEGSLRTGVFTFRSPELVAGTRLTGGLALKARFLRVDLAVTDWLSGTWRFEEVLAEGVEGVLRTRVDPPGQGPGAGRPDPARTPFTIDLLAARNLRLDLRAEGPGGESSLPLELDTLVVTPFRSDWILVDLLAHSRLRGRLEDQALEADSTDAPEGRVFRCRWTALPAEWWSEVGAGPLACLSLGTLDLDLAGVLTWEEPRQLVLRLGLDLRGTSVAVPGGLSAPQRRALAPLLSTLHGLTAQRHWTVDLSIQADRLRGADSLGSGIREPLAEAAQARLEELAGVLDRTADPPRMRGKELVRRFLDSVFAER